MKCPSCTRDMKFICNMMTADRHSSVKGRIQAMHQCTNCKEIHMGKAKRPENG